MAYPPRQFHEGYWYHVYTRHQRKKFLFPSEQSRLHFLDLLDRAFDRLDSKLGAFCLMDTHYHLLVEMGEVTLDRIFQSIHSQYAKFFNDRNDGEGNLFARRPGMEIVLDDSYILQLITYIHKNPVEAEMVSAVRDYNWSSDARYRGLGKVVYDFDSWKFPPNFRGDDRRQRYKERLEDEVKKKDLPGDESYIGSKEEWENLERRDESREGEPHRERRGRQSMEEIVCNVGEKEGYTVKELRRQGREQPRSQVRQKAMVELYREGYGPTEIGEFFNRTKSAVVYAVNKYRDD